MSEPTTAAGRLPTPDDPVHRDENGYAIEELVHDLRLYRDRGVER